MDPSQSLNAIEEINILGSLDSPHIVKYHDSFISDDESINILMEYCSNGDLGTFLDKRGNKKLPEKYIWKLFLQILAGLHHLHSKQIIHRDLKSLNVFLTKEHNAKIGDMGAAKVLENRSESEFVSKVGTPYYLAPEVCTNQQYSYKSDVWALG